jgi:hypothetical protein
VDDIEALGYVVKSSRLGCQLNFDAIGAALPALFFCKNGCRNSVENNAVATWVEIQDVEIARTIPYPTNCFDVSMPQGVDVYGVRWIHKKAPEKSRDNNICFFGTVLYKNGAVVPQYRNSGLSDALLETTDIRQYCFYNCVNINGAIDLPNVENIGEYAFNGCNKITEVTLGANIRTISTTAFSGCSGITLITIPRAFGTVLGAPWGATNAQIVWTGEE